LKAHAGGHFDPLCVEAMLGHRREVARIQRRFRAEAGFHEAYDIDGV
jgi:hypothetical protein